MAESTATTPVIAVEDLIFDYATLRALHNVSLTVEQGSITALVGPNGAGKTTLLRCMAALDTPYSGRILVEGEDAHADPRAVHRKIGYLSDFFGLYDELTVRQCLRHAVAMHGFQGTDEVEAVTRVAGQLDLEDLIDRRAGELSRGQRQRLAIAQAIVHQPTLILLDEPASGLDPLARQSLSDLLLSLRDEGMTLIVSSHILAELEDYSSHVLVMDHGRIVEHRAIEDADGTRMVLYALELAAPTQGMLAMLTADEAVLEVVALDDLNITFRGPRDLLFRRDLLKRLIGNSVPVTGLAEKRMGLTEIYREVATSDEGQ
ncbi:MAG: ABC transporter ATP-binding protein [Alphaproteobacteria bacterium]|jgi:ABC-2 type transport system ATP-binding protein|nr:ABC transporter ATP-binding protein [Rhodospirillaceae bacterium]MBT6511704.1 ABC transporter ATP-binding protein [Rhodospirillaceae bacterium]MBT7613420.1 ABC transporter ATP-binding protein [Rhodospirillaceae bacterium]MDG2480064.1 ABC transporter ATP-binding protein [Alphaproteobacteria bacterium]